ncbi:leukosialin [Macrotis lagotis]|uniref:leukosialin n=1 Tax=Macrotis lagotis TaxID=92651 RepID=UPI003D694A71
MTMMSCLSLLLLLILPECFCTSTAIIDSQTLNSMLVPTSPAELPFSVSHPSLETTSVPVSSSDMSSSVLNTSPFTLTTEARDSSPAAELPFSTTLAPSASGLIPVNKGDPSSTQELATHISTVTSRDSKMTDTGTTPFSIQPSSDVPRGQEETTTTRQEDDTTLLIKETTFSKVNSANTTTSTKPSDQVSQTPSTITISFTKVSSTNKLKQDEDNNLLIILVVVILVVTLLIALILLWRRRQKRRTGALLLVGSGKQKGAGDAWAGPVQVVEDQATPGSGAMEADTGNSEGEGHRPTLTTFFGKRKSRQGSLMLEDLEKGTVNNLKDESEPLVENIDGAVKPPEADESGADGLAAGDGNLPSAPVAKV